MSEDIKLPSYTCYKRVQASKIRAISGCLLDLEDGPRQVDHDWLQRHHPAAGGYFVVYEDGYQSFSPASAFEAGYKRDA